MSTETVNLDEFLQVPSNVIHSLVYPKQLSVSLLLNGTRRWYISQYFDAPPLDNSYFPHYLKTVLSRLSQLLKLLAEHGIYRVFIPVYSWYQPQRNPQAFEYLIKGIQSLTNYDELLDVYQSAQFAVRFYGDTSYLPRQATSELGWGAVNYSPAPLHHVFYGVEGGNAYNYSLQLAHEFGARCGRAPQWEDMLQLYYGDRSLRRLDILIGFNRIYSRGGIPHLLEGGDRIYVTVVTPLVLNTVSLRTILYDYLFNRHDFGRDYKDIHPNEILRLKQFYAANQNVIMGLGRKYEDLVYPTPSIQWPDEMDKHKEILK